MSRSILLTIDSYTLKRRESEFSTVANPAAGLEIFSGTSPELGKPTVSNGGFGVSECHPSKGEANYYETRAPMVDHRMRCPPPFPRAGYGEWVNILKGRGWRRSGPHDGWFRPRHPGIARAIPS